MSNAKTQEQESHVVSLEQKALAPAGAVGVASWVAPEWTAERLALAKKAVCPPGTSDHEFEFFIAWCKRTGLDPFVKQAYLIERRQKMPDNRWVSKHEPMASEAGLAARADTMPDFRGIVAAPVYAGDRFVVDAVNGKVTHEWDLESRAKAGNKLLGAWAHAKRSGRQTQVTYLPLASRIQTNPEGKPTKFWATMPEGQILKCARAEQYRLAYPNIFGGVYIREEMSEEEIDVTPASSPAPAKSRTESVMSKVKAKLHPAASPPRAAAADEPPAEFEGTTEPAPPAGEGPPPTQPQSEAGPVVPVVTFGPSRGKEIHLLSAEELADSILLAEGKLNAEPSAAWAPKTLACLEQLKAEQQKRVDEAFGGAA